MGLQQPAGQFVSLLQMLRLVTIAAEDGFSTSRVARTIGARIGGKPLRRKARFAALEIAFTMQPRQQDAAIHIARQRDQGLLDQRLRHLPAGRAGRPGGPPGCRAADRRCAANRPRSITLKARWTVPEVGQGADEIGQQVQMRLAERQRALEGDHRSLVVAAHAQRPAEQPVQVGVAQVSIFQPSLTGRRGLLEAAKLVMQVAEVLAG